MDILEQQSAEELAAIFQTSERSLWHCRYPELLSSPDPEGDFPGLRKSWPLL